MEMMYLLDGVTRCSIDIDPIVPGTIRMFVNILKIVIPIILVVLGMLDMAKAVMANEEKEMKEAQKKLIKRLIYAVVVFFIVALVQFVFGALAKADTGKNSNNVDKNDTAACIACFISDKGSCFDPSAEEEE